GLPAVPARVEREELVELARRLVDDQRVPVAVGAAPALDRHGLRDRVRPLVALVGVVEVDAVARRALADDDERDADRPAVPETRTEVGMEPRGKADRPEHRL